MGNRKPGGENLRVKHLIKSNGCVCALGLELVGGYVFTSSLAASTLDREPQKNRGPVTLTAVPSKSHT